MLQYDMPQITQLVIVWFGCARIWTQFWPLKLYNYITALTSYILPDSCQISDKYGLDYMESIVELYCQKTVQEHHMLDNSQLTASHLWYNEEIMNLSEK